MRSIVRCGARLACASFIVLAPVAVHAETPPNGSVPSTAASASPAPFASPTPSPLPARRWRIGVDSTLSYTNQQFSGPGALPPEAGAFASGQPIAPGTPYDLWTSSPNVTGFGVVHTLTLSPSYALSRQYVLGARAGFGSITGNANVAAYWGDQPMPSLNPHLGKTRVAVAFPCANHADPMAVSGSALLNVSLARADGALSAEAGWFALAHGEPFVVNPVAQTSTPIAFTEPLPEGLGDGPESLPPFATPRAPLPLYGVRLAGRPRAGMSVELSDALLPEPPGTQARLLSASLAVAHDGGISFGAQVARLVTGGAPIGTTVLFGADPATMPSPQGPLPTSTLAGQRMTVAGVRAEVPLGAHLDAQLRLGASCYAARGTALPQSGCTAGGFRSLRVRRTAGDAQVALEAMRMDATYAPAILPYGIPENVWSPAYSWPGTWLKGTYQLVDDATMGPNREGLRATSSFTAGALEARLSYTVLRQIDPFDATTAYRTGFVEGFYLPQLDAPGTLGSERHAALTLIAHARLATIELDATRITLARGASTGHPDEAVAIDDAGVTLTLSRRFGTRFAGSLGAGRNAIAGAFDAATPNVGLAQRVAFGSLQWSPNAHVAYALQYRLYAVDGMPTSLAASGWISPAYHGLQLMLEQRLHL
jgi:hypothetical protein